MTFQTHAILEKIKMDAITHMYLQSGTAYWKNLLNNAIAIPNIVIGGILSVSIMSTTSHAWKITSGVLAVCSTILSSLSRHMKYGEEAQLHCAIVKKYNDLITDIEKYALSDSVTPEVIQQIHAQILKIYEIQPDPSIFVVFYFNQKYKHVQYVLHPELETIARENTSFFNKKMEKVLDLQCNTST